MVVYCPDYADQKYIICNADEGEPGTFKDRLILEGDPHSVIEAMAIAGYAVGADKGIVYIRGEYHLSIERLQRAAARARKWGSSGRISSAPVSTLAWRSVPAPALMFAARRPRSSNPWKGGGETAAETALPSGRVVGNRLLSITSRPWRIFPRLS